MAQGDERPASLADDVSSGTCPARGLPLRGAELYSEPELDRAALRIYTKPLFEWRKALQASTDGSTFHDFARRGLQRIEAVHRALAGRRFQVRPGRACHFTFHGKHRTIYLNRGDFGDALASRPAPGPVDRQVLAYHARRGTTSPRHEEARRKFPYW